LEITATRTRAMPLLEKRFQGEGLTERFNGEHKEVTQKIGDLVSLYDGLNAKRDKVMSTISKLKDALTLLKSGSSPTNMRAVQGLLTDDSSQIYGNGSNDGPDKDIEGCFWKSGRLRCP